MSRAGFLAAAAASLILIATALSGRSPDRRALCPGSLVPAYLEPDAILQLADRSTLPRLLVINPASGPGTAPDPAYRRAIAAAQSGGAQVLGYVPTTWGTRPAADAEAEIDRYRDWYRVDGVFLDETAAADSKLAYYHALSHYARSAGAEFVVLNPGLVPARGYFQLADAVVTFEGPISAYRDRPVPEGIDPERTAHLVYGASREQALQALEPSPSAGYVYVTSGTLPHPWGTVPEYFTQELAALGGCR
jgi:Spherulation-specific family 4